MEQRANTPIITGTVLLHTAVCDTIVRTMLSPKKMQFFSHRDALTLSSQIADGTSASSQCIHLRASVSNSVYLSPECSATYRLNYNLKHYQQFLYKIIREKKLDNTHTHIHTQIKIREKHVAATVFISVTGQKNLMFTTSFSSSFKFTLIQHLS